MFAGIETNSIICKDLSRFIDKSTFDIVQKIRENRKRPTKMGEMPMFSGILYCTDCEKKLSFHRRVNGPDSKHNFVCSNYRSDTYNCSMHYIRNVVVEQLVLENLREVVSYVKLTPEIVHEFIDRIIVHEADKSSDKRIQEIEIIYNHIGVFGCSKVNVYMEKAV